MLQYQPCQMVVLQVKLRFENFTKIFYVWKLNWNT